MMAKYGSHMTEKILNLTLEFIYLLTGERCAVVKMAAMEALLQGMYPPMSKSRISVPAPSTVKPERPNQRKIQEVTSKMIELLTREDLDVFLSMEKREYVQGHKELCKETKIEHVSRPPSPGNKLLPHPPLPDGSKTTPERSPQPHYSQDSTQEGHMTPHHYQGEELSGGGDEAAAEETDECCIKVEEISPEIGTDGRYTCWDVEEEDSVTATLCKAEGDDITADPPVTPNVHPDLSSDPDCAYPVSQRASQRALKPFPCTVCGKFFCSPQKLISHQKSHTVLKPYSCAECGKCFTYRSKLISHEVVHTVVKPYSCNECGKGFTQKSNLTVHKTLHAKVKPYTCSECGKSFYNKGRLTTHLSGHTTDKLYFCSECGICFSRKSNFLIHRRSHRGEKQHSCTECGKIFPSKSELTRHERVHTGEKPYPCFECGRCFSNKRGLINHGKRHRGGTKHDLELQ